MNDTTKQKLKDVAKQVVATAADTAANALDKPKEASSIAKVGLNLVKSIAPTALSFIPGVGPILGKVADAVFSTNDDSWFDGFTSAGATFNELLQVVSKNDTDATQDKQCDTIVAGFAAHLTALNFGPAVKECIFPSVLADIRDRTNNVLVEDVANYWKAFEAAANLYAIYYTGKKYLKLAQTLPTNIQELQSVIGAVNPIINSQFRGIIDTLGDYLKVTTALPEAYVRYMHWRFGTTFLSDNTDKAGLILYDYYSSVDLVGYGDGSIEWCSSDGYHDFIKRLDLAINYWKSVITSSGRAMSDIRIAYKKSVYPFEVEERHYDTKEFCLRVNKTGNYPKYFNSNTTRLIMNNALNMNAAIQGTTLSTAPYREGESAFNSLCPFPITYSFIAVFDNTKDDVLTGQSQSMFKAMIGQLYQSSDSTSWYYIPRTVLTPIYGAHKELTDAIIMGNSEINFSDPTAILPTYSGNIGANRNFAARIGYILGAVSLQEHFNNVSFALSSPDGNKQYAWEANPLGYNTAFLTPEQIDAIHRTALRNLVRIDYHFVKKEDKAEVKAEVTDLMEEMKVTS